MHALFKWLVVDIKPNTQNFKLVELDKITHTLFPPLSSPTIILNPLPVLFYKQKKIISLEILLLYPRLHFQPVHSSAIKFFRTTTSSFKPTDCSKLKLFYLLDTLVEYNSHFMQEFLLKESGKMLLHFVVLLHRSNILP